MQNTDAETNVKLRQNLIQPEVKLHLMQPSFRYKK